MIAIAEALVESGHHATVLSQPSVKQRAEDAGCRFIASSEIGDHARYQAVEQQPALTVPAIAGSSVGNDLIGAAGDVEPR